MSLYFIAVVPHKELRQKARVFSKDFAERFNSIKSFENFPHITLIKPFHFDENQEEILMGNFSEMNLKSSPFEVILKNFGCFPNKDKPVIFIKPESSTEFQLLYDEVQPMMKFHSYAKIHPHLTVAYKDLSPENFQKAWREYQKKTFEDSFLVDKVCLFKHENKKWNLLKIKYLN
ncbi:MULTISPECIES: 2'-5' RNA ligase family protein [unclassified Kaistella]|uniref:2'-5' RNA ligase family protein n=1 Tax=unclassified Kaistella TaxID=2762626 RepID=UPI002736C475|nr:MULTISPECIES: 2'-5' RNA ligase family protein [unclassified Kaistella]MDP2454997.1 2'-5' RNA ligase family protein [Kaistella sp. SH11-4b]MDP2456020.1 2'-5' RNA ligase family protein [Kaistella sp. SH40-3]MDP2460667.1 2'-5' RNA ligase family protein [Kaistella sp. SH19-2b]